jgi:hypothetical protein
MISITKVIQAADSVVIFDEAPRSQIKRHVNRVSKTPTLDGGAVLDSQGYSIGDRNLVIRAALPETIASKLWALFKSELYINISTNDGYFFGSIERMEIDRGKLNMTILIKE